MFWNCKQVQINVQYISTEIKTNRHNDKKMKPFLLFSVFIWKPQRFDGARLKGVTILNSKKYISHRNFFYLPDLLIKLHSDSNWCNFLGEIYLGKGLMNCFFNLFFIFNFVCLNCLYLFIKVALSTNYFYINIKYKTGLKNFIRNVFVFLIFCIDYSFFYLYEEFER